MDPQWALLAAALVFIITPGIALFYGGRERATSMVNMMMLSAGAIAVTTIVWTLWGWSLAFAGKDMAGGIFGDPMSGLLFRDSMVPDKGMFTSVYKNLGVSAELPAAFRLACAIVAVSLITGALAGRVRYAIWLIFVAVWITLVFAPISHMVYGGGLLSPNGAIAQAIGVQPRDFAGGSVLNITAAISALAIVFVIGGHAKFPLKKPLTNLISQAKGVFNNSRAGMKSNSVSDPKNSNKGKLERALWEDVARSSGNNTTVENSSQELMSSDASLASIRHPHNVPFVMLGIFIIWFGWLGLMIGSSTNLPFVAAYAWVSSTITASASMLAWGVTERLRYGRFTGLGAASGVMAGLAASSAAANVISPLCALILGVVVGVVTSLVSHSKTFSRYDGALHVVSVNGVAAFIGLITVGLFADCYGLFISWDWHQLVAQLCLIGITILYAGAVTAVVAFALEKLFGWRISEAKERKGVDLADQGERAYDFSAISQVRDVVTAEASDESADKTQVAVSAPADLANEAVDEASEVSETGAASGVDNPDSVAEDSVVDDSVSAESEGDVAKSDVSEGDVEDSDIEVKESETDSEKDDTESDDDSEKESDESESGDESESEESETDNDESDNESSDDNKSESKSRNTDSKDSENNNSQNNKNTRYRKRNNKRNRSDNN